VRWFTGPDAAAHGFAACGALASLAAIALFPIVRWMS
jgi:hypothetical protein